MKKDLLKTLSIALIVSLLTPDVAAAASLPGQTVPGAVSENNAVNAIESGQDEGGESMEDIPESDEPEIERALTYHDAEDPVPVMTRAEEAAYANRGSLPSKYSSVTAGRVPALRDQGSTGTCWAFAAVGASESGLISRGIAGTNIDLSERHLAYYFYEKGNVGDLLGGTTGDYNKLLGGYNYMNRGGNSLFTMWHLVSWAGLADESKAPFSGITTALPRTTANIYGSNSYHLQNAYIVNKENTDVIKQLIMDYGSLAFAYYSTNSTSYDNLENDSYYFNIENAGTNHAVQVVGWDDTFSKDRFSITPPGDGAWLVKNSWGEEGGNYAQNGYFWLSYYDTSISDNFFAYVCEKADNYDNIYQYDGAAGTRYIRAKQVSNIYTVKANKNGAEKLEAVGVGVYDNGVSYTLDIYTDLTNPSNPASGTKVVTQKGTLSYSGYHTIPLTTPVLVEDGQKFSVVFTFDSEKAAYVDYTYSNNNWVDFITSETVGTSFYKPGYTGAGWIDSVDSSSATFRIKAYTSNVSPGEEAALQSIVLDKSSAILEKGESIQLKVSYRPSYTTDDKTVLWSSSNQTVASVDVNGRVTAVSAGTAVITAACGTKKASCTVTVRDTAVIAEVLNNDAGTFTIKAMGLNAVSGISQVRFAVWSEENGQDDLIWYTAANGGNGVYTQNISIKNHGSKAGRYIIHAYVYDNAGGARLWGQAECVFTRTYPSVVGLDAKVSADEENVTITATGVLGMGTLKFAVWSDAGGQDDLTWYTAVKQGGNTWTATVPISRHRYSSGRYQVHAYGENIYSASQFMKSTSFQISAPVTGKAAVSNVNNGAGTFTVEVSQVSAKAGVRSVQVAVWSTANQSNLVWYTAVRQSNGTYTVPVNIANHGYQYGTYTVHVYITDYSGNTAVAGTSKAITQPKTVLTAAGNASQTQYNIKASGVGYAGGVKSARVAVWSAAGGQDDLVWYNMVNNGNGVWSTNVPISAHRTAGTYYAHMYITDQIGNQHMAASAVFKVDAPIAGKLAVKNLNNSAGTFNLELTGGNAKAGINNVQVAVWSTANQSNLVWYTASRQSDGSYTVPVNIANHGYQYGTYTAHAYITDNNGIASVAGTSIRTAQPSAVLTAAGNANQTQYNIRAAGVGYAGGVKSARVAVWSAAGGQDDLVWYNMINNGNGVWSTNVPVSAHKTAGTYYAHLYIEDKIGNLHMAASTIFKVDAPSVERFAIKNPNNSAGTFTVEAAGVNAKAGIASIRVAVWSEPDQSNLVWYTAVRQSDGSYIVPVNIANHKYRRGTYIAHGYVMSNTGITNVYGTTVSIK